MKIGAGGKAQVRPNLTTNDTVGGSTTFDNITPSGYSFAEIALPIISNGFLSAFSSGGAGYNNIRRPIAYKAYIKGDTPHYEAADGKSFGCGGSASISYRGNTIDIDKLTSWGFGNGYQGCVILRYFNPDKI